MHAVGMVENVTWRTLNFFNYMSASMEQSDHATWLDAQCTTKRVLGVCIFLGNNFVSRVNYFQFIP